MQITRTTTALTALFSVAILLASCGGTSMSGGGNNLIKKRERKEGNNEADKEAKDPKIVTGAYLSCEVSTKDPPPPANDAVGCKFRTPEGNLILPTAENKVKFFKSVNGGTYSAPTKENTASGYQALFELPKTETARSRFIVAYKNKSGMDELVCEGAKLPCTKQASMEAQPTYMALRDVSGVWVADGFAGSMINALDWLQPQRFCHPDGSLKEGDAPVKETSWLPFVGSPKIERASGASISREKFCAKSVQADLGSARRFANTENGCHVAFLQKRGNDPIDLIHSNTGSKEIKRDYFTIVVPESKMTKQEIESTLAAFSCSN
jgi:hypothetical protein